VIVGRVWVNKYTNVGPSEDIGKRIVANGEELEEGESCPLPPVNFKQLAYYQNSDNIRENPAFYMYFTIV